MNKTPNDHSHESPSFLPILGIILGTIVFIIVFVFLLYALYVWLGPWIASILVILMLAGAFYAAYRLFWQFLGPEMPADDETDA